MKENENIEEKSNHDKYKDAVYKDGKPEDLFRIPKNPANFILKYCDDRTLLNLLTVNKSWNEQINELRLSQRQEYLKYFMWYVYGCGNAERLCKIVDDVANEHKRNGDDKDEKFLLWHMVLLDILNIKISDLKLDFEKEKSESIEKAIKNCLLTGEAVKQRNDFIDSKKIISMPSSSETLLWEYSRKVFPEFENVKAKNVNVDTAELLGRIFACFLKVAFYQIKRVEGSNIDGVDPKIYKQRKNKIRYFNCYLNEQIFDRLEIRLDDGTIKYQRGEVKITSSIAAYLFETEELETWFHDYNKDFFDFFCTPSYFICCDDGETIVEFFGFAFYLNKIKSFETRYRENPDEFWQTFYINIVKKESYRGNQVITDITSFISQTELQNKMRPKIDEFEGYAEFRFQHYNLFDHQKLDTINVEEEYFSPIIIRFCGQKDLSDKVIQSISKVIKFKCKNRVDHEVEVKTNNEINNSNNKCENKDSTDKVVQSITNVIKAEDGEDHKDGNKISEKNKVGFQQQPISKVIESTGGTDHEDEANVANNNSMVSRETDLINKNETGNVEFKLEKKDLANGVIQPVSKVIGSKDGVDHEDEVKINVENNPVQNNLIASNEINFVNGDKISSANNKLGDKNKVGFWQHFIFVLFFIFTCLSLFLCFKISLYFLILVAVFVACDLYLGFKNYCRGCCCTLKIKTPVIDQDTNSLVRINPIEPNQNLIDDEIEIPKHI